MNRTLRVLVIEIDETSFPIWIQNKILPSLSPSEISTVEMKHPTLPKPRLSTLDNFNPRHDIKPNMNTNPPGRDPGRYPADAKDCAIRRAPRFTIRQRIDYIVGFSDPAKMKNVVRRTLWGFASCGSLVCPRLAVVRLAWRMLESACCVSFSGC